SEIGHILGVPQSAVSHMMKGFRRIRPEHIQRLKDALGEQLVVSCIENDEVFNHHEGAQMIQATIINREEDITQEVAEEVEIKETIILTPEQINQENIDLKKEIEAGTLDVKVKPTQDVIPPHHAKVYTENDEMSPEIEANDPVFVRFLANKTDFINGRMYFVDLENGSVVRWVVRDVDDHVRLISMKDEEVVPLASVRSISEVVAITKRPKTLPKERVTFDEAIARKDNQLDTLLEQQGRLIGIIEKHTN
ncbi:MAG: hypothetical protein II236_00390, partial [Alistipes sp.]|nr:hypothetical protein [Alistipes sp.]